MSQLSPCVYKFSNVIGIFSIVIIANARVNVITIKCNYYRISFVPVLFFINLVTNYPNVIYIIIVASISSIFKNIENILFG